jgi:hypothetical protein
MEQALRSFIQGLPTAGNFRMQMRLRSFTGLPEAVEHAARLEQVLNDERPKGVPARAAEASTPDVTGQLTAELAKWRETQGQLLSAIQGLSMGPPGPRPPFNGAGRGHAPRAPGPMPPRYAHPPRCYGCDEIGHIRRDCPKERQGSN